MAPFPTGANRRQSFFVTQAVHSQSSAKTASVLPFPKSVRPSWCCVTTITYLVSEIVSNNRMIAPCQLTGRLERRGSIERQGEPLGLVFNVMRFSIHDGPGIRTTVFMKGCPLCCWWCHNPESQSSRPELIYFEERCIRCGDCVRACPEGAVRLNEKVITDSALCQQRGECVNACSTRGARAGGPMDVSA